MQSCNAMEVFNMYNVLEQWQQAKRTRGARLIIRDALHQLDVWRHDRDAASVGGTEVGPLQHTNDKYFRRLLQCLQCQRLYSVVPKTNIGWHT